MTEAELEESMADIWGCKYLFNRSTHIYLALLAARNSEHLEDGSNGEEDESGEEDQISEKGQENSDKVVNDWLGREELFENGGAVQD